MTATLDCPPDMAPHLAEVLNGEYDIEGLEFSGPALILDVGANCGAFTAWALQRWPGCTVIAYEPNPAAFAYLKENMARCLNVATVRAAVTSIESPMLHLGVKNLGQASLYDVGEQQAESFAVEAIKPADLPDAHVIKVDTEGAELDILSAYVPKYHPDAVMFEFHRASDRVALDALLLAEGYSLWCGKIRNRERGTLCYLHTEEGEG